MLFAAICVKIGRHPISRSTEESVLMRSSRQSIPARYPFCGILLIASGSICAQTSAPDAYPSRPVRVIVPYTPGGGNDILARMVIARAVTDLGGRSTVVDNRPGGNTVIGTQLAARSPADGYTLLTVDNAYTTAPSVQINLPYDTLKDFARVTMMANTSPILVVHPSVPVKTVKELIALAKAQPGKLA